MLEQLLDQFEMRPEQAVMVGDTEFDMEMAVNANMPRIAVSYGAHDASRLRSYGPIACVDCFSEIVSYI
jgi:phosphoglycolate phosphatase